MGIRVSQQARTTEVNGYVQGPFTFTKFPNGQNTAAPAITAGVQIEKESFHANLEIGAGPSIFKGRGEVGHNFELNKNLNLDLAGVAEYKTQLGTPNRYHGEMAYVINHDYKNNENGVNFQNKAQWNVLYDESWNNGEVRFGAKAETQYNKKLNRKLEVKLGVGVEGGYRTSTQTDRVIRNEISLNSSDIITTTHVEETRLDLGGKGAYVTPRASLEVGNPNGLSFIAKGDLYQQEVGLRVTF